MSSYITVPAAKRKTFKPSLMCELSLPVLLWCVHASRVMLWFAWATVSHRQQLKAVLHYGMVTWCVCCFLRQRTKRCTFPRPSRLLCCKLAKGYTVSFTAWYWTAVTVLFSVYYTEAFMSLLLRLARAVRLGRTALVFRILLRQLPSKFEALWMVDSSQAHLSCSNAVVPTINVWSTITHIVYIADTTTLIINFDDILRCLFNSEERKIDMHLPRQVPCTWGREPADIYWTYCWLQLELSLHPGPQGIRSWLGGASRVILWNIVTKILYLFIFHVFEFLKTTGIVRDFQRYGVFFFYY